MPTSDQTPNVHKHSYSVDPTSLYQSLRSFVFPLVEGESLQLTLMMICQDDEGKPHGVYHIPKIHREVLESTVQDTLSNFNLYLDNPSFDEFSIHKIYNGFDNLDIGQAPLKPVNLAAYFDLENVPAGGAAHSEEEKAFIRAENAMLNSLIKDFDPEHSSFLPLPIIGFGELVGVAYLIYDETKSLIKDWAGLYRILVLAATREYEGKVTRVKMNKFADSPEHPLKDYRNVIASLKLGPKLPLIGDEKTDLFEEESFLKKLHYDEYYQTIFEELQRETDDVFHSHKARVASAIISIIVDSFAHNVGAHTLVALKWWFENRFKIIDKKFAHTGKKPKHEVVLNSVQKITHPELVRVAREEPFHGKMNRSESAQSDEDVSLLDVIRFMDDEIYRRMVSFEDENTGKTIARNPIPIDFATYRFFEFLRNKSAFWSGVTRDVTFSGRLKSWPTLLRDFLTNSLFLGTVAHSEGINRVNFHLEILNKDNSVKVGGEYARINLDIINYENIEDPKKLFEKNIKEFPSLAGQPNSGDGDMPYSPFAFVRAGGQYDQISKVLKRLEPVFLPSEIIGQQAFYTLIENSLRNIKHYNQQIEKIKEGGIDFYMSIKETGFLGRGAKELEEERKLFQISLWIHHEQELIQTETLADGSSQEQPILQLQLDLSKKRIIGPNGDVRLGGSSQDKICAAMLMNNTFESIDEYDHTKIKKHYFPYVFPATESFVDKAQRMFVPGKTNPYQVNDFSLHRVLNTEMRQEPKLTEEEIYQKALANYLEKIKGDGNKGVIKKTFFAWKGKDCLILKEDIDESTDNLSRYRIVAVQVETDDEFQVQVKKLREKGIMRVVRATAELRALSSPLEQYHYAIAQWLGNWLGLGRLDESNDSIALAVKKIHGTGRKSGTIGLASLVLNETKDKWELGYLNGEGLKHSPTLGEKPLTKAIRDSLPSLTIAHGEKYNEIQDSVCQVRTHCSFNGYLYGDIGLENLPQAQFTLISGEGENQDRDRPGFAKPAKLLENYFTCISIFDNRVHERLYHRDGPVRKGIFSKMLSLTSFAEKMEYFGDRYTDEGINIRKALFEKTHFLIVHLSFIEAFYKDKDQKTFYKEDEVQAFFKKEIQEFFVAHFGSLPKNFLLVITSGRGRGDWVAKSSHPQITFRPIESVVNAIEDGLSLKDDFQVKHNLCNVLYGS